MISKTICDTLEKRRIFDRIDRIFGIYWKRREEFCPQIPQITQIFFAGKARRRDESVMGYAGCVLVQRELDIFLLRLRECPAFGRARFF